ncbi:MAG TPA: thioesterase family protein [Candidatus Omnitrophota bacterium]|nr:thioesterase family protein [Candidatus Omnitrophota bacterium]HPT07925.1 thioesterase family protein [Candidatus Omnitrophota bacterium]
MKKRIFYHDTDCGGVVYYANYLKYTEEARTEYFEEKGVFIKEWADKGVLFVVAHQEIDYRLPAVYGDILEVRTHVAKISAVKIETAHEIRNQDDKLICEVKIIMVCVDKDIKPRAIPGEIAATLKEA